MRTKICNGYLSLREIDLSVDNLHYLRTKLYTKIKISSKKKVEYILTANHCSTNAVLVHVGYLPLSSQFCGTDMAYSFYLVV
jgi:hypothetical protein